VDRITRIKGIRKVPSTLALPKMTCNFCPRACEIHWQLASKRPDFSGLAFEIGKTLCVTCFCYGEQTGFSIVTLIACVSGGAIETDSTAVVAVLARWWGTVPSGSLFMSSPCVFPVDKR
jgi:hypothetical protein